MIRFLAAVSCFAAIPFAQGPDPSVEPVTRSHDVRLIERASVREGIPIQTKSHLKWIWSASGGWGIRARTSPPLSELRLDEEITLDWLRVFDQMLPIREVPYESFPIEELSSLRGTILVKAPTDTHDAIASLLETMEAHLLQSVDIGVYVFEGEAVPEDLGALVSPAEVDALLGHATPVERGLYSSRVTDPLFVRESECRAALLDCDVSHAHAFLLSADAFIAPLSQGLQLAVQVYPTEDGGYVTSVAGRYGSKLELGTREASILEANEVIHDLPRLYSQLFTSTGKTAGDGGGLLLGASSSTSSPVRVLVTVETREAGPKDSPFIATGVWNESPLAIRALAPESGLDKSDRGSFPYPGEKVSPERVADFEARLGEELGASDLPLSGPRLCWLEGWALPRGIGSNRAKVTEMLKAELQITEEHLAFELRAGEIDRSAFAPQELESLFNGEPRPEDLERWIQTLSLRSFGVVSADAAAMTSSVDEVSFAGAPYVGELRSPDDTKAPTPYSSPSTRALQSGIAATVSADTLSPQAVSSEAKLNGEVFLRRWLPSPVPLDQPQRPVFATATLEAEVLVTAAGWSLLGAKKVNGADTVFIAAIRLER